MTTPAEAAMTAMTSAHAEAILARTRVRPESRLGLFTRVEMDAALHLLGEARTAQDELCEHWYRDRDRALAAEAERDRLKDEQRNLLDNGEALIQQRDRLLHDLAAEGWQPLPADWHAQAEAGEALVAALAEVTVERDRLADQVQRVRDLIAANTSISAHGTTVRYWIEPDALHRALDGPAQ